MLLHIAQLSRSTFYYQLAKQKVDDPLLGLKQRIQTLYHQHKGRYGYRRITAALRQSGELVNHKKVQRLMQQLELKSLVRIKNIAHTEAKKGKLHPIF